MGFNTNLLEMSKLCVLLIVLAGCKSGEVKANECDGYGYTFKSLWSAVTGGESYAECIRRLELEAGLTFPMPEGESSCLLKELDPDESFRECMALLNEAVEQIQQCQNEGLSLEERIQALR